MRYLYRAIDEYGQVLEVLSRDHRHTESATAFFRQALHRTGTAPTTVVSDHHLPYMHALQAVFPEARHIRTGLHRARGETTKPIECSHVFTCDRRRASRGLKTVPTGQRFLEGFAAVQAPSRGHVHLERLVPGYPPAGGTPHERARAVARAVTLLGPRLRRAP